MNKHKKNAIENRLDSLIEQWNEFAQDADAYLLRWLVNPDEARMIDVFLESENESGGQTPDLFLVFDEPFENLEKYTQSLVHSLDEQYQASREGMEKEGLDTSWKPSQVDLEGVDINYFIQNCNAFKQHYTSLMEHLVLVFIPESITDVHLFLKWLNESLNLISPADLKIMIVDNASSPLFDELAQSREDRVMSVNPQLDMPGAMMEIVQGASGHGPDYKFRCHFVALTNAAEKGDLTAARRSYSSALTVANEQKWFQMQVVVHMALGATFFVAQKYKEALACYQDAARASEDAIEEGDESGKKLLMQSRLAGAAVFISEGKFENAAKVYELTVPLAEELEDKKMTLECWRMAAYCYEQTSQDEISWDYGLKALATGQEMDESDCKVSTLAYASQGLLRVAKSSRDQSDTDMVKEKTATLLGENWEESIQGEPQAS